jgi:hypothetical protein
VATGGLVLPEGCGLARIGQDSGRTGVGASCGTGCGAGCGTVSMRVGGFAAGLGGGVGNAGEVVVCICF